MTKAYLYTEIKRGIQNESLTEKCSKVCGEEIKMRTADLEVKTEKTVLF